MIDISVLHANKKHKDFLIYANKVIDQVNDMNETTEKDSYEVNNSNSKHNYKKKKLLRKEAFKYLKFNNILTKVENNIIWILEELKVNPKIIKSTSIKYLLELLKTIVSEKDDLETMKTKIIQHLKIQNRMIMFSVDDYDYIWEVLESPADYISFRKIYKKKKGNKLYSCVEEIVFNKSSRETHKKYIDKLYENNIIIVDTELSITHLAKRGYKINVVNIKNNYDNSIMEFTVENENKQLLDKQQVLEYLDKIHITYYRRILQSKEEKIYEKENEILLENSRIFEERINTGRERGGFFRTRFDSAETDD